MVYCSGQEGGAWYFSVPWGQKNWHSYAAGWNAACNDDHRGYVTRFELDDAYARQFEVHTVGAARHRELWVPTEELDTFNRHICGKIEVIHTFCQNAAGR